MGRSDFAWEFLRRNPCYRAAVRSLASGGGGREGQRLAQAWGLQFMVDPEEPAPRAAVFWRPEVAPGLVVVLEPSRGDGGRPLRIEARIAAQRQDASGLHLRLECGLQALIRKGGLADPLAAILPLCDDYAARLRALDSLQRLIAARPPVEDLAGQQRDRLTRCLVALDAASLGQSYRQIAETVFGEAILARAPWRTSSARDAAIRLVQRGRRLRDGAYRRLLDPAPGARDC